MSLRHWSLNVVFTDNLYVGLYIVCYIGLGENILQIASHSSRVYLVFAGRSLIYVFRVFHEHLTYLASIKFVANSYVY